jgi:hypothetical protein
MQSVEQTLILAHAASASARSAPVRSSGTLVGGAAVTSIRFSADSSKSSRSKKRSPNSKTRNCTSGGQLEVHAQTRRTHPPRSSLGLAPTTPSLVDLECGPLDYALLWKPSRRRWWIFRRRWRRRRDNSEAVVIYYALGGMCAGEGKGDDAHRSPCLSYRRHGRESAGA